MIIKINSALFFVVLLLLTSCETNPPILPENDNYLFKIIVTSNIEGASIFVDDEFTGKLTPDTLLLLPGNYEITLEKDGYLSGNKNISVDGENLEVVYIELIAANQNKIILIEDFANVSCDPCVISNRILRELETEMGEKIAVIKYSTNFPSPSDPFYLSAKALNDARMSFYNILFAPTIIIDGIERPIPTDSSAIKAVISDRINSEVYFTLEVEDSISNNSLIIEVKSRTLNSSLDITDYRLYAVVLEEEISYTDPPGSNGETTFYNVMRSILPDTEGAVLSDSDELNNFEFSTEIVNNWNINELITVAFIQNIDTGEIINAFLRN